MTVYPSASLTSISQPTLSPNHPKLSTIKSSPTPKRPVVKDTSTPVVESSIVNPTTPQPKPSACKQCQFCSHFQLELTHWGHCNALGALVPGKATACMLHQPYFSEQKTVVPLAQLQRPTMKEDSLKALKANPYYQYPSAGISVCSEKE